MYIEPNGTVKFLADCPLDVTQENTIYFTTLVNQQNYFAGLAKYTLTEQSYMRHTRGKMRVELTVEELYNCNYMMFQNTNFGLKWFYAFIDSVEYVNNNCAEVSYTIDVLQTWHFDYELEDVFVEREHSESDNIGDNIVDEGIAVGDYMSNNESPNVDLRYTDLSIVVAATFNSSLSNTTGTIYNGTYSGINYLIYDKSDYTKLNTFLSNVSSEAKQDGIVSIFMCPTELCTNIDHDDAKTKQVTIPVNNSSLGGYVPKNNKMYCYPYNYLLITNNNGSTNIYKYELFYGSGAGETMTFVIEGNLSPTAQVQIAPTRYKGSLVNYNEKIVCDVTTQCSYITDAYKAWLAQHRVSLATTVASASLGVGGTIAGALTGNVALAAGSAYAAVNSIMGYSTQNYTASLTPQSARGAQDSGLNIATASVGFDAYYIYPTKEYCRIIDDYFSRYGYATRLVKKPNRHVRKHWTYCKTVGCCVTGNVPADDKRKICELYDKGITWWANGNDVGQYLAYYGDNTPI